MEKESKTTIQAEYFFNRLVKRYKHLKKWANRENIHCFRLYDKDIPEIPLSLDIYNSVKKEMYAVLFLYERPYEKDEKEELEWLNSMKDCVSRAIDVKKENIFVKIRKRQKDGQYEKETEKPTYIQVIEHGSIFLINLSSYLDSGLFFDHRPLRKIVLTEAGDKSVLNLFCYTGAFSVHAARGGAKSVDSVDLSKTYVSWVSKNFELNNLKNIKHNLINEDVVTFLKETKNTWDIIILDPPTFSNSKKTDTVLDINRDYPELVLLCLKRLTNKGKLYFSTNSRTLKFDENLFKSENVTITDISRKTIPEDFRNTKIHRCWVLEK